MKENFKSLKHLLDVAAGRVKADLLIKNCRIVDVCSGEIREGEIAIAGQQIAAADAPGLYEGEVEIDAQGLYALPALIDAHIHVESSMCTPEELSRLLVPLGTGTLIADPHEIVNVAGREGLDYMRRAAAKAALHIEYLLPSCVPATPFEHAGATITAEDMEEILEDPELRGLAEFMNFPGIVNASEDSLNKLLAAKDRGKLIDGHSPGLSGKALNAYASAGILADHECSTVAEMQERIARGMFVLLRRGSACHDLDRLLPGVTAENSRRCLLCSDDRQAHTILSEGHLDDHLRRCVRAGLDPLTAIRMATLNTAEAFGLKDRGALVPGRRADITLMQDLRDFKAVQVFLDGREAARDGRYLLPVERADDHAVKASVHLKDFSEARFRLPLKSDRVHVIEIQPGGVLSKNTIAEVQRNAAGDFIPDPSADIIKVAVVERHKLTGNVAVGLLKGYGLKEGTVALSIAHDSHNVIVAGRNDHDMALAVEALVRMGGGVALVNKGQILGEMPLPIAGLMSDQSGEWVAEKLAEVNRIAVEKLGVNPHIEPVMTLCFMSLPVIPELKLTDMGLFDVTRFSFIPLEAEESSC